MPRVPEMGQQKISKTAKENLKNKLIQGKFSRVRAACEEVTQGYITHYTLLSIEITWNPGWAPAENQFITDCFPCRRDAGSTLQGLPPPGI